MHTMTQRELETRFGSREFCEHEKVVCASVSRILVVIFVCLSALTTLSACSNRGKGPSECGDDVCGHGESAESCARDCVAECDDPEFDNICSKDDNCPEVENNDQIDEDEDEDGVGDACDVCPESTENDADGDTHCELEDNCLQIYNINQIDSDEDGWGNACDSCPLTAGNDTDHDTLCGDSDNCPDDYNPGQADGDDDGIGDACDLCPSDNPNDADNDGSCDSLDTCLGGDDNLDDNDNGVPDSCEDCGFVQQKRFTVSFEEVYTYHNHGPLSFQVSLYHTGDIAFQYKEMNVASQVGVGIEAPHLEFAMPFEFDEADVPQERIILYRRADDGFLLETSYDAFGPPYEWVDEESGADFIDEVPLQDDVSKEVSLPFAFTFMGESYSSINVASNGYLWFGSTDDEDSCCEWESRDFPTGNSWQGFIAAWWMDLNPTVRGKVRLYVDTVTCEQDCVEEWGGYARVDDCDICAGGTTGVGRNQAKDYVDVCFGEAITDSCDVCSEGTTGHVTDSDDVGCGCFEEAPAAWYPDEDGDGLGAGDPVLACRWEVPATHVQDNSDTEPDCITNDTALCGACGGLDCNADCNGGAFLDPCNICSAGSTGREPASTTDENHDGIADACHGPDLIVDVPYLEDHFSIDHVFISPNSCFIPDRCVTGAGNRKILRFGTKVANLGNEDLAIGTGSGGNSYWTWNDCMEEYDYQDYAEYQLIDTETQEVAVFGRKYGFCVMDLAGYDLPASQCDQYNCGNQGITAGCSDIYVSSLDCQWIDITNVADGTYTVRVTTNPSANVYELNYENNSAAVAVEISGESVTLVPNATEGSSDP